MKKINPKIVLVALGLLTSSLSYGQSSVDSLSDVKFYNEVLNTEGNTFKYWLDTPDESNKAIKRLDMLLSEVNFYFLIREYDRIEDLLPDSNLRKSDVLTFSRLDSTESSFRVKKEERESHQHLAQIEEKLGKAVLDIRTRLLASLIVLCELNKESSYVSVSRKLSFISHRETARDLYTLYKDIPPHVQLSPFGADRNLKLISEHLNVIDKDQLMMYSSYTSSPKKFKSIDLNHGNDIFTDFNLLGFNQDREMTGSFRLSVTTDYFKARFWNIGKHIANIGKGGYDKDIDVFSYQTISFGGIGFTPYIRYQDNIELADTFHNYDRPFGSFVYLSRSKNRLWQKGLARHVGEFQIGFVGLESPDAVQASLHKDFITSSQRVYGWNKQIGDPGRLIFQLNHDFDFLLFSNTNKYRAPLNKLLEKKSTSLTPKKFGHYSGANIVGSLEGKFGSYMTAVGGGLRFSTLDFMHQSGQNSVVPKNKKKEEFGCHFESGIRYRRVIHNSMLEGIGFGKPFEKDSFDIDPIDLYTLSGNTVVQRNMFYFDWKVVLQWRKMAFYFQQTYHNLEYNVKPFDANSTEAYGLINASADSKRLDYYNDTTRKEYPSLYKRGWYGYGTIGMTWFIE
ncbi:MAG: hypothetical protein COA58_08075 [Bacteroidetes bacterium]|nr:MAG: hypothetical protein COA58_08075 [Bacteroidota bacterium]